MSALWLGPVVALCLFGCAPSVYTKGAQPVVQASGPTPLQQLLEDECSACHEGHPDRPTLNLKTVLDDAVANRALLLVSASLMPPKPAELSPRKRAGLIEGLCVRRLSSAETCLQMFDVDVARTPYVRPAREFADDIVPPTPTVDGRQPRDSAMRYLKRMYSAQAENSFDLTMELFMVALTDRCRAPNGGDAARIRACVDRILAVDNLSYLPFPRGSTDLR